MRSCFGDRNIDGSTGGIEKYGVIAKAGVGMVQWWKFADNIINN
jgi:hypothetical protein